MTLTTTTPFSSSVILAFAVAFAGFEAMLCYMGLFFSGLPTDPAQLAWLLIGLLLFVPAAASWWYPRMGLRLYLAGLGCAVSICLLRFAFSHTSDGWGYCLGIFEPAFVGGALLVGNAFLSRGRR